MTVLVFPLQKTEITFGEELVYRWLDAQFAEGVLQENDLRVSQNAAGANLSVDVAAGDAYITFDSPL